MTTNGFETRRKDEKESAGRCGVGGRAGVLGHHTFSSMHLHTATKLLYLAFLSGGDGLRVFRPSSITIRRQVGQLGFATETEWQYAGGKRNPLDPSQPSRTVEASGASVRLFEARLADGSRSLLKEFLGAEARAIGERELAVYRHLEEEAGGAPDLSVGTLCGHMISDEASPQRHPTQRR